VNHNRRRGRPPHDDVLTPAEWKVTHAVQHGMSNRDVAERSGISVNAIKFHVRNVLAKLGLADRTALRQWYRAPKGSALATTRGQVLAQKGASHVTPEGKSMATFSGLGPIAQISRTVSDIQLAERWYGQVLGMTHLYTFGKLAFFDCGGARLYLQEGSSPASPESIIYFRVEDIEQAYASLKDKGVEFTNAPHMIHRHPDGTEEWLAAFQDPDGRPLAIMAQVRRQGSL
jgi:DNA-binding CsgD family transcriptional regulator/predicted enzyme related to lactoylglutathione lyase